MSGSSAARIGDQSTACPVADSSPCCRNVRGNRAGWATLATLAVGILAVWGWVLPAIGSGGAMRRSIENTDRLGINPGAIFYSDIFQSRAAGSATDILTKGDDECE